MLIEIAILKCAVLLLLELPLTDCITSIFWTIVNPGDYFNPAILFSRLMQLIKMKKMKLLLKFQDKEILSVSRLSKLNHKDLIMTNKEWMAYEGVLISRYQCDSKRLVYIKISSIFH